MSAFGLQPIRKCYSGEGPHLSDRMTPSRRCPSEIARGVTPAQFLGTLCAVEASAGHGADGGANRQAAR